MNQIQYSGKVDSEGKLRIYHRDRFISDMAQYYTGKDVIITVAKKVKKRSSSQLGYYFGAVVPIVHKGMRDIGHNITLKQTDAMLRNMFLTDEIVNEETGQIIEVPLDLKGESGDVSTTRFMQFTSDIQQWAAEFLGINIPDPKEQTHLQL